MESEECMNGSECMTCSYICMQEWLCGTVLSSSLVCVCTFIPIIHPILRNLYLK